MSLDRKTAYEILGISKGKILYKLGTSLSSCLCFCHVCRRHVCKPRLYVRLYCLL